MKFKRLKIPSDKAISYLKNDNELSQYWEQLNRDCYGEIIIDSDTLDHIGHVFVWHTKKNKGFIFNLEVKPQYRRQGYGWILLDDAVKKYDGIDLLVDEDNIPAIKLYKKYGFETIKTVNGQLWMKLNQIKQEGVIMFFDRLGNSVTGEPKIVEEPVVESYYDPNRPVRPGFEKPQPIQEGLFDVFKPKPSKTQKSNSSPKTIEDVETIHDIVIDKDFKKFMTENPNGGKFKYPNNKIVSKEILEFIDDEGDPSICSLNQFINANCEYDGCIETCDYCLYIGGWIDDKGLYLATNKSSCVPAGSIIFSDVIENGYDYNDRIFAKSFKELLKNATFGKVVKEYSDMDLDEMSDYIQENVIVESTSTLEPVTNLEELLRHGNNDGIYYGTSSTDLDKEIDGEHYISFKEKQNRNVALNVTDCISHAFFKSVYSKNKDRFVVTDIQTNVKPDNISSDISVDVINENDVDEKYSESMTIVIYKLNEKDCENNLYRDTTMSRGVYTLVGRSEYKLDSKFTIDIRVNNHFKSNIKKEHFEELSNHDVYLESKINAAERNELDDDDFGLVYTDEDGKKVRKYPLTDENHIRQAVRFFSHCPDEHKPHLARKILKKANEHDMDTSNWETIHEWAKK